MGRVCVCVGGAWERWRRQPTIPKVEKGGLLSRAGVWVCGCVGVWVCGCVVVVGCRVVASLCFALYLSSPSPVLWLSTHLLGIFFSYFLFFFFFFFFFYVCFVFVVLLTDRSDRHHLLLEVRIVKVL